MYDQPFFISEKISNNAFSFERRGGRTSGPKIFVPALKNGTVDDVTVGDQIVFEDFDDNGNLQSCRGLTNFIQTSFGRIPVYIFDNHNHAFYFWHLQRLQGRLRDGALLIHIDQHKDTRIPESFLPQEDAKDPEKIFRYANTILNVGNFIPPAQKTGLIGEIIFLDSEYGLQNIQPEKIQAGNMVLDIDLDFFAPASDYIGNDFKLSVIKKLIPKAAVITFATSPFFIDQNLAISWLKRIAEQQAPD